MKKENVIILWWIMTTLTLLAWCNSNIQNSSSMTKHTNVTTQSSNNVVINNSNDPDHDWLPNDAEKVLWTDPLNPDTDGDWINDKADKNPTFADNFTPSKWIDWLKINKVLVENNVDPVTKKGTSDHLEVFVTNTTSKPISNLTLYYKDTDISGAVAPQSYIIPLKWLILQPNKETSIHIDTSWKPGHFRANPNSMYYLDKNWQTFEVILNAKWYNAVKATVKKDPGGAELAD